MAATRFAPFLDLFNGTKKQCILFREQLQLAKQRQSAIGIDNLLCLAFSCVRLLLNAAKYAPGLLRRASKQCQNHHNQSQRFRMLAESQRGKISIVYRLPRIEFQIQGLHCIQACCHAEPTFTSEISNLVSTCNCDSPFGTFCMPSCSIAPDISCGVSRRLLLAKFNLGSTFQQQNR
jgi:hypothetical protein